jgi:hypothetical protein
VGCERHPGLVNRGRRLNLLLMIVRMLDIRLMILPLTLVSGPAPKEGSWDAGDRPTKLGEIELAFSSFSYFGVTG